MWHGITVCIPLGCSLPCMLTHTEVAAWTHTEASTCGFMLGSGCTFSRCCTMTSESGISRSLPRSTGTLPLEPTGGGWTNLQGGCKPCCGVCGLAAAPREPCSVCAVCGLKGATAVGRCSKRRCWLACSGADRDSDFVGWSVALLMGSSKAGGGVECSRLHLGVSC